MTPFFYGMIAGLVIAWLFGLTPDAMANYSEFKRGVKAGRRNPKGASAWKN